MRGKIKITEQSGGLPARLCREQAKLGGEMAKKQVQNPCLISGTV
jgi:hypothetical protein